MKCSGPGQGSIFKEARLSSRLFSCIILGCLGVSQTGFTTRKGVYKEHISCCLKSPRGSQFEIRRSQNFRSSIAAMGSVTTNNDIGAFPLSQLTCLLLFSVTCVIEVINPSFLLLLPTFFLLTLPIPAFPLPSSRLPLFALTHNTLFMLSNLVLSSRYSALKTNTFFVFPHK